MKEVLFSDADINDILNRNVAAFLDSIRQSVRAGSKRIHLERPQFPIFGIHNPEFYEQKHYENTLNWNICDHLINGILFDLFSLRERIDDTVKLIKFDKKRNDFGYPGVRDGYPAPFAFILETESQRVGYLYKYPREEPHEIDKLMDDYGLHYIEVFDWSEKRPNVKTLEKDLRIRNTTMHEFMLEFFSEEIYTNYVKCVNDAIHEAKYIIGYQTISNLSLRHLWNFRLKEIKELEETKLRNLQYQKFSNKGKLSPYYIRQVSIEDFQLMLARCCKMRLYYSLVGIEPFARCFMTSEYLYHSFKVGNEHYFDYTSIATGYFKSVELLLYKIMKSALTMNGHDGLKITCKNFIKDEKIDNNHYYRVEKVANGKTKKYTYVKFCQSNEIEFNIEMGSLICFIEDNKNGWYAISDKGRELIIECLRNYNCGCRNQHFHKDIIDDINTVESIRNNTLLCLFYLIGGCKFADDETTESKVLGVVDDSYDRLYRELKKIPVSNYYLQFQDSEQQIMAIRFLYKEGKEKDQFDQYGHIISTIRLVKVDDFSACKFETEQEEDDFIAKSREAGNEIVLSRDNVPTKMWWYNSSKGLVEIHW